MFNVNLARKYSHKFATEKASKKEHLIWREEKAKERVSLYKAAIQEHEKKIEELVSLLRIDECELLKLEEFKGECGQ